jgi:hypothetical protein
MVCEKCKKIFLSIYFAGEKKLTKVITPDVLKAQSGAKGAAVSKATEETKSEETKETSGIGGFRKVTDSIAAKEES